VTDVPLEEIEALLKQVEAGESNPKNVNGRWLASSSTCIIRRYCDETGEVVYPR